MIFLKVLVENREMKLLVFTLFIAVTTLERTAESFNVTCSTTSLLLQIYKNGSLNCLAEELISDRNSSLQVSVVKINGGDCGTQDEMPITQVRDSVSDNQTKSVMVLFHNVSWQSIGNYSLKVIFGNVTKESNFSIEVYDVPVLPKASSIGYMIHIDRSELVFAFYGPLPKRDKCAKNLPISYEAGYRLQNCSKVGEHGKFDYSLVPDTDGKSMDQLWYAESLTVCKEKEMGYCKVQIDLTARNSFGILTAMTFVSDRVSNAVNLQVFSLMCNPTSKSVIVTWESPCKVYDYSYSVRYKDTSNGTMQTINIGNSDEQSLKYTIKDLRPATTYKVCVRAKNMQNYRTSDRCCKPDVKTKEDIPSRNPEIIGVQHIDPKNGDIRWKVAVFWKLPEPQFWNGKVFVVVKYWETRKPNDFEKSRSLTSSQTNFTLNDLYFDRDYFVQVCLCTSKGCSCSKKKYVGHKKSEPGSGKEWMAPVISICGVALLVILVIVGYVIYRCRKDSKYGTLHEEQTGTNGLAEDSVVNPRPYHDYEEPSSGTVQVTTANYDVAPLQNNSDNESALESDREENLNAGSLQIHENELQDERNDIELVRRV